MRDSQPLNQARPPSPWLKDRSSRTVHHTRTHRDKLHSPSTRLQPQSQRLPNLLHRLTTRDRQDGLLRQLVSATRPDPRAAGKKAQSWKLAQPPALPAPSSAQLRPAGPPACPSLRHWRSTRLTCRPVSQPHRQPGGCRHHDPRRHLPVLPARLVRISIYRCAARRSAALPTSGPLARSAVTPRPGHGPR